MKTLLRLLLAVVLSFGLSSCEDLLGLFDKKVDQDGLTKEIRDLVPSHILETIESLGMPINGGGSPPNIANRYNAAPFILVSSNVPGDFSPGYQFPNLIVRFYNQDNKELTISMDYQNGSETGTGLGGFIVGDNDQFTVFAELTVSRGGETATAVMMISGQRLGDGIKDLYMANFMIDNKGNPGGIWIPEGTGRVLRDSDGMSEIYQGKSTPGYQEGIHGLLSNPLQLP